MMAYLVVVFGGGSLAILFFVRNVLGIDHPNATTALMVAWMVASAWVYHRWTTGTWVPPAVHAQMPRGELVRGLTFWAVGFGGAFLLYEFWPAPEPWPTAVGVGFLGATFAVHAVLRWRAR